MKFDLLGIMYGGVPRESQRLVYRDTRQRVDTDGELHRGERRLRLDIFIRYRVPSLVSSGTE